MGYRKRAVLLIRSGLFYNLSKCRNTRSASKTLPLVVNAKIVKAERKVVYSADSCYDSYVCFARSFSSYFDPWDGRGPF